MRKSDAAITELCHQLGEKYSIKTIDFEKCIYRNFQNGYDLEVSGVHNANPDKKATLYLWRCQDGCRIEATYHDIAKSDIGRVADHLQEMTDAMAKESAPCGRK